MDFRIGYLARLAMELATGAAGFSPEFRRHWRCFVKRFVAPNGGFMGRSPVTNEAKTGKIAPPIADAYYTSFGLRCLAMLGADDPETTEIINGCSDFLQHVVRRSDDLLDEPTNILTSDFWCDEPLASLTAWFQSAAMIDAMTGRFPVTAATRCEWFEQRIAPLRRLDGGFALTPESPESSTYATFLVLSTAELTDLALAPLSSSQTLPKNRFSIHCEKIAAMLADRQNVDGGFSEIASLGRSGTNPTAAAIALLRMIDERTNSDDHKNTGEYANMYSSVSVKDIIQSGVLGGMRYLLSSKTHDGGFPAHPQLPLADLLSSLTAMVALRDIKWLARLGTARFTELQRRKIARMISDVHTPLRRFAESLETPDGGFRSVAIDTGTDVEYTFYGLAIRAFTAPAGTE